MEFRLTYRGSLKSNGKARDKQQLREVFHSQLKELWKQDPLSSSAHYVESSKAGKDGEISLLFPVGQFVFAPLVSSRWFLVAETHILFLRPSQPGQIIGHGGDLDNRMKTLFDGLRMPNARELPARAKPSSGQTPFFCLFEDDALLTGLSITTDRLLDYRDKSEVQLIIRVDVKPTKAIWGNIGI